MQHYICHLTTSSTTYRGLHFISVLVTSATLAWRGTISFITRKMAVKLRNRAYHTFPRDRGEGRRVGAGVYARNQAEDREGKRWKMEGAEGESLLLCRPCRYAARVVPHESVLARKPSWGFEPTIILLCSLLDFSCEACNPVLRDPRAHLRQRDSQ